MNLEKIQRKGISPIIATLLLILIAIAAGVIVYAYVVGFIGNSTSNSGGSTSVVSIDNLCASATTNCAGTGYSVTLRNVGSTTITASSAVSLYFNDVTAGTSGVDTSHCSIPGTGLAPGATLTCSAALPAGISAGAGHQITVKAVMVDGGASTASTKEIS
jgi:archaeal type IV pilus assembly protein PilA